MFAQCGLKGDAQEADAAQAHGVIAQEDRKIGLAWSEEIDEKGTESNGGSRTER
jgi:hypothetical protein